MGMTIDKAILRIEHSSMSVDDKETADFIIDTMHKYQKIEKILSDWKNDDLIGMSDYWMGRIKEVVEDGKID